MPAEKVPLQRSGTHTCYTACHAACPPGQTSAAHSESWCSPSKRPGSARGPPRRSAIAPSPSQSPAEEVPLQRRSRRRRPVPPPSPPPCAPRVHVALRQRTWEARLDRPRSGPDGPAGGRRPANPEEVPLQRARGAHSKEVPLQRDAKEVPLQRRLSPLIRPPDAEKVPLQRPRGRLHRTSRNHPRTHTHTRDPPNVRARAPPPVRRRGEMFPN